MYLRNYVLPVLSLPRWAKRSVVLAVDTGLCILTVWLAFYLRLGELVTLSGNALAAALVSVVLAYQFLSQVVFIEQFFAIAVGRH